MSLYGCTKCVTNEASSLLQCEECSEFTKHIKTEEDYKPDTNSLLFSKIICSQKIDFSPLFSIYKNVWRQTENYCSYSLFR